MDENSGSTHNDDLLVAYGIMMHKTIYYISTISRLSYKSTG